MRKNLDARSLALHKKNRGQFRTDPSVRVRNKEELSLAYTPGIAAVAKHVAANPEEARLYTMKGHSVAIVSDGSAVLGLGNVGPLGALPVMEGKATLFKSRANIDAIPIVLDATEPDDIVAAVARIAPGFGGINLEDIAAPKCFEIEQRLAEELPIPVMHDDQHGTAIVVLAGLINALAVVKKTLQSVRVVISGAGAAGTAIAHLLRAAGVEHMIVLDRHGAIGTHRPDLSTHKMALASFTNRDRVSGGLADVLPGADVLIGVSGPGLATAKDIFRMAGGAIVFALANPIPEIFPEDAAEGGAAVIATGRSDFPNQLNNSLVFPGVFRGALDHKVRDITRMMKLQAAKNLAGLVKRPSAARILPDMFDARVVKAVASAIREKPLGGAPRKRVARSR